MPVHPRPLAFILLSLEFFLLGIALSFRGGFPRCLIDALASGQMNDTIGRPAHLGMCAPDIGWPVAHNRPIGLMRPVYPIGPTRTV